MTLELDGKEITIPVGVSEYLGEDMLMGRDVPHFRRYLKRVLEEDRPELTAPSMTATTEEGMTVTCAQQKQRDALPKAEHLQQQLDGAIVSIPPAVEEDSDESSDSETDQIEVVDTSGSEELQTDRQDVISPKKLGEAQRSDPTLKGIRKNVCDGNSMYFWEKGLLKEETVFEHGKGPNYSAPSSTSKSLENGT